MILKMRWNTHTHTHTHTQYETAECKHSSLRRMQSSGTLRCVALVRTGVSEKLSASFIRVTRISQLGTTLAVTSIVPSSPILVTVMKEALSSSKTSVLTRATKRNIWEDAILHSHRHEDLKSYIQASGCVFKYYHVTFHFLDWSVEGMIFYV
jgi:hypothetical protein